LMLVLVAAFAAIMVQDRLRDKAEAERERILAVVESGVDYVDIAGPGGAVLYANRAMRDLIGHDPAASGDPFWKAYSDESASTLQGLAMTVAQRDGAWHGETMLKARDGHAIAVSHLLVAHRAKDGSISFYSSVSRNIDDTKHAEQIVRDYAIVLQYQNEELERANGNLAALATTDGLTSAKNHRAFQEQLDEEILRTTRYEHPLSLILVDVDHFKDFNDAHGHPAGDLVLKAVARILGARTRETDTIARYGGEEFGVILPETTPDDAVMMAERMRQAIECEPWPLRAVTASFGVASLSVERPTKADLIAAADRALYSAKRAGRNRVWRDGDDPAAVSADLDGTFQSLT